MSIPSPSPAGGSAAASPTPRELRLDAAFEAFCARSGRRRAWTPDLRAEVWALFARECRELRAASGMPSIFGGVDLESLSPDLPRGYRLLAEELLTLHGSAKVLAVGGTRGTGKTAMAAALVRSFCDSGRRAVYTTAREYFDVLGSAPWEAKQVYRDRFYAVDLLVLDEVQVRDDGRQWQDNELTTLIDVRYRNGRATLLLSNLTPAALKGNLGESVWRRLIETGGQPIEVDWPRLEEWFVQLKARRAAKPKQSA